MSGPKILTLDIECSPMVKYSWSLFSDYGSIDQIIEQPRILCAAAKWKHRGKTLWASEWNHGREGMLERMASWIDEADIIQGWNSQGFDYKWITGELVMEDISLPSPVKHLDLMKVTRKAMRLPSYKLDYVAQRLGVGQKIHTEFQLWKDVLDGKKEAQAEMKRYNIQDVLVTEAVGQKLRMLPLGLPHFALFDGALDIPDYQCRQCASLNSQKRGPKSYTNGAVFQQYHCNDCGSWWKGSTALVRAKGVPIT